MESMTRLLMGLCLLISLISKTFGEIAPPQGFQAPLVCSPSQEATEQPVSQPFRIVHPRLKTEICLFQKEGHSIPIYFYREDGFFIPDSLMAHFTRSHLGGILEAYFNLRESSAHSTSSTGLEFEWLRPPAYDWFERRLDFAMVLRRNSIPERVFAKSIFLVPGGYRSFELDQTWHPASEKLALNFRPMIQALQTDPPAEESTTTLRKDGTLNPLVIQRQVIFPPHPEEVATRINLKNQSFIERNRHFIGAIFLITAMLFFMLVPRPNR